MLVICVSLWIYKAHSEGFLTVILASHSYDKPCPTKEMMMTEPAQCKCFIWYGENKHERRISNPKANSFSLIEIHVIWFNVTYWEGWGATSAVRQMNNRIKFNEMGDTCIQYSWDIL